jgi:hypothetical protein
MYKIWLAASLIWWVAFVLNGNPLRLVAAVLCTVALVLALIDCYRKAGRTVDRIIRERR